jgi:methylated-DNA-[protein]-cysteine S-methyltransferase
MPSERVRATSGAPAKPVAAAAAQLTQYFAGTRQYFELDLHVTGTRFQQEVWLALASIPYGQVRTYGDVAAAVGRPNAYRAVGNANGRNPWPIIIPCHRVVASTGIGGYAGGLDVKRFLLALEGVR